MIKRIFSFFRKRFESSVAESFVDRPLGGPPWGLTVNHVVNDNCYEGFGYYFSCCGASECYTLFASRRQQPLGGVVTTYQRSNRGSYDYNPFGIDTTFNPPYPEVKRYE